MRLGLFELLLAGLAVAGAFYGTYRLGYRAGKASEADERRRGG